MTIQKFFVAELTDVLQVQVECKCGTQLALRPDKTIIFPGKCPHCEEAWIGPGGITKDGIRGLLKLIKMARESHDGTTAAVRLVFDIEAEQHARK